SSVGKGEVDVRSGKLVITYRDKAIFRENIYPNNATITTVYQVTGDGDTVLEYGEVWAVKVDVSQITGASLDPNDIFSIEIKPPQGSLLKVERRLPPSFDPVMDLT
ncbi:MAG: hypothetical protein RMH74_01855, partial [Candidatus Caldarchaeum sp.]|nr:hypothetical protein [Candidatus Caldarchaeum sp.]